MMQRDVPEFKQRMVSCAGAGLVGAVLGMLLCVIVNTTLVEISLSEFFAFYFGILFITIGLIVVGKLTSADYSSDTMRQSLMVVFAALVLVSGLLCVMFNRDWFFSSGVFFKLFVYSFIGASVSFAIVAAAMDPVNYCVPVMCDVPPLFESMQQVYLLMITAIVLGLTFGVIFASTDVGANVSSAADIRDELEHSEKIGYPFAFLIAGSASALNQWWRSGQLPSRYAFDPLRSTDEDEYGGI